MDRSGWTSRPFPTATYYAIDYRYQIFNDGGKPESTTVKKLVRGRRRKLHRRQLPSRSRRSRTAPTRRDPILRIPQGYRIATDDAGNLYVAQGFFVPEHTDIQHGHQVRHGREVCDSVRRGRREATLTKRSSWSQGRFKVSSPASPSQATAPACSPRSTDQRRACSAGTGTYVTGTVHLNRPCGATRLRTTQTAIQIPACAPNFSRPFDIGLDDDGNVYVLSTTESKIVKYDRDGHKIIADVHGGDNNTPDTFTPNMHGPRHRGDGRWRRDQHRERPHDASRAVEGSIPSHRRGRGRRRDGFGGAFWSKRHGPHTR